MGGDDKSFQNTPFAGLKKRHKSKRRCKGGKAYDLPEALVSTPDTSPGSPVSPGYENEPKPGEFQDPTETADTGPLQATTEEEQLFVSAMADVAPLSGSGRDVVLKPEAVPRKGSGKNARNALEDIVNGKVEFSLEFTDEYIQAHVKGLGPKELQRLKAGRISVEGHLDLHGLNAVQAHASLIHFVREQYLRGHRCLLVIPGRGKNSPQGYALLREKLQSWLMRDPFKRVVLAFCTAQPRHGGAGALYVLLRKYKKGQGRVQWEKYLRDTDIA